MREHTDTAMERGLGLGAGALERRWRCKLQIRFCYDYFELFKNDLFSDTGLIAGFGSVDSWR